VVFQALQRVKRRRQKAHAWVTYAVLGTTLAALHRRFREVREEVRLREMRRFAAWRIQRYWRRLYLERKGDGLNWRQSNTWRK